MQIMKLIHVVYIYRISLLFSRSILTSKEINGKTCSETETEQNMSDKTGKRPDYVTLSNEIRKSCDE